MKARDANSPNSAKCEVVVDSDRISTALMALLLLCSIFFAIVDVREIIFHHVRQFTYGIIIAAAYTAYLAAMSRSGRLFRIGAAAIAIGSTIRIIAHYYGLSSDVQHTVGISESVLALFACIVILFATARWFRQVVRIEKGSENIDGVR